MIYFGSEMVSVGRTVIRAIRAIHARNNNNRWNVFHQLRESFKKRRNLMLVWRYTIILELRQSWPLQNLTF